MNKAWNAALRELLLHALLEATDRDHVTIGFEQFLVAQLHVILPVLGAKLILPASLPLHNRGFTQGYPGGSVVRYFRSGQRRQRVFDGGLYLRRLGCQRIAHPAQLAAQAIDLVEETEDQRQRLLVDGEFLADFQDQLDTGDVDFMKNPGLVPPLGQYPTVFDPPKEVAPVEPLHLSQQLVERDHAVGIPCRGSNGCCGAHFSRNAASSGSELCPMNTLSVTISSPGVFFWMPLPRRRNCLPVSDPFGIVIVTGPVTVNTDTLAPSTASATLTCSSRRTLSPSRRNSGWGATCTSISASPAGPPPKPGPPLPLSRST